MPGGRPLTRKKEAAIAALLCTGTIEQAAQKAGICERTLKNWLATPDFAAAYRAARQQVVEHVVGVMQSTCMKALETLERNMSCGKAATEVVAAGKILEHSLGAVELFELAGRVAELEQKIQTQGASHDSRSTFPNGQAHGGPSR
jgi:hypothetical protein